MGKHDNNSLGCYSEYKCKLWGQVFCETLLSCKSLCGEDQIFLLLYFFDTFGWMESCESLNIW